MSWLYTHWAYIAILVVSLAGLSIADRRWKLVFFAPKAGARQATLATIGLLVGFFLIWDIVGILLGIFYTNPRFTLGINLLSPNLPIEEVLFLTLLVYSCLLIDIAARRWFNRRETHIKQPQRGQK